MLIARKALRDLLVVAIGAVLLHFSENVTGFGIPAEYAPIVSALSLVIYRFIRNNIIVSKVDPK